MSRDYHARVEQRFAAHAVPLMEAKPPDPDQLLLLRKEVLEISLMLPPEKQIRVLLQERLYDHVDQDILDLRDGYAKHQNGVAGPNLDASVIRLKQDIINMLSHVLTISRSL
jgi:hypothetical protein